MSNLNGLTIAIFPGNDNPTPAYSSIYDQTLEHWTQLWTSIFTKSGANFDKNVFLKSDRITAILHQGEVISFFLSSFYPLQPGKIQDNKYFTIFPPAAIETLRFKKANEVMTFEYLTVMPDWRKKKLGFPLGAVMIGIGLNAMIDRGCQAAVGVARIDAKVDKVSHEYNAMTLTPEVMRANIACEIVAFFPNEITAHPDSKVSEAVSHLWAGRKDYFVNNDYAKTA